MKKLTPSIVMTLAVIGVLPFVIQACTESKGNGNTIPKTSEPIPVKVVSLNKSTVASEVTTSGQLTTDDETILAFKIGGVIQNIYVKEGDAVKKGQLLATLDLTEINAQVSQARYGLEKAQRDFERVKNLYRDSVATLEQLQNTETALSLAREQLQSATFNQRFAEIHAPASGYVLHKFANDDQVVGIGDPVLKTNGAGDGKWILKAGVSDRQWAIIRVQDKATVSMDAFPARRFQASVIRKSETADPQTGAFTVELQVKNDHTKLASGMFGKASIQSGGNLTSWRVPYEAVLDAQDDEGFVFITADNKTAQRQPVTIASFDGESILISKGLEEAQALIISGSAYLTDKSPIIIIQ
ncbi:MAG TPA: efflux RND transporter periplasmic adaptor subunit [Cyclobacteriaceae bacterium]|nr:efflux RND transporter periplasmic adaptor subunit [Cyclobacteriaceae bacterium]